MSGHSGFRWSGCFKELPLAFRHPGTLYICSLPFFLHSSLISLLLLLKKSTSLNQKKGCSLSLSLNIYIYIYNLHTRPRVLTHNFLFLYFNFQKPFEHRYCNKSGSLLKSAWTCRMRYILNRYGHFYFSHVKK